MEPGMQIQLHFPLWAIRYNKGTLMKPSETTCVLLLDIILGGSCVALLSIKACVVETQLNETRSVQVLVWHLNGRWMIIQIALRYYRE